MEEIFELFGGTYEEYIVGLKFVKENDKHKLVQSVASHSHLASVRSIATYDGRSSILASGGTDETVHLFDMRRRLESGILMNNSGTVTCLRFTPDGTHLVCASEDGSLSMYRAGNWELVKKWTKAHNGLGVYHVSVHPSGKLALSVGADKTLRTWNLVKGRPAYTINLTKKVRRAEVVEWAGCGQFFGLQHEEGLDIYSVETGGSTGRLGGCQNSRVTCFHFLLNERVVVGDWSGHLTCYTYQDLKQIWQTKISDSRIKTLTSYQDWLITVAGQGLILVFDVPQDGSVPVLKCSHEAPLRITCLAVSRILKEDERPPRKKKKKQKNAETLIKEEKDEDTSGLPTDKTENSNTVICYPPKQNWTVELMT